MGALDEDSASAWSHVTVASLLCRDRKLRKTCRFTDISKTWAGWQHEVPKVIHGLKSMHSHEAVSWVSIFPRPSPAASRQAPQISCEPQPGLQLSAIMLSAHTPSLWRRAGTPPPGEGLVTLPGCSSL